MRDAPTSIIIGRAKAMARADRIEGPIGGEARTRALSGPMRRRFTAEYKLSILGQAAQAIAAGPGHLEKLLSREGLYSSHLSQWRKRLQDGSLESLRRGRKALSRQALLRENRDLRRKMEHLEGELRETASKIQTPRDRDPGAWGHAGGFLRHRLLRLAESARKARCGEAIREPVPGGPGEA